jgi:copper transport protein
LLVAGVLATPVGPGSASAIVHAHLVASSPAAGDTLGQPPAEVRLVFSEPVEAALAGIRLVRPGGAVLELPARADPADVRVVVAPLPALDAGGYRVVWRVVSADGHTVSGDYAFYLEGAGAEVLAAPPPPPADPRPTPPVGLRTAVEGLAMAALLLFAGSLLFLDPRVRTVPRLAAALALVAPLLLAGDFLAWAVIASPGADPAAALARASRTTPGRIELVRLGLVLLAAWALALARRPRPAAILALAAVLASGGLGHALARSPLVSIPAKAVHLGAAAAWLGALVRLAGADPDAEVFPPLARRVSSVALISVAVIGATGILQAALLLPELPALWESGYGRLVLAKAGGLAALVALGAFHRFRLLPHLDSGGAPTLRRSVRREILVFAVVLLVAAWLAQVPPPDAGSAALLEGAAR